MSLTKLYEGMFLFDSNLASKDWPGLENHVQELLTKNGAEPVYTERWPDRKLCYEIKGCRKGTYYLVYFKAPSGAIDGLKHDTELSERILRLLVVYDEELAQDCEKRLSREVSGCPEEIEEQRERARLAAAAKVAEARAAEAGEASKENTPGEPADSAAAKDAGQTAAAEGTGTPENAVAAGEGGTTESPASDAGSAAGETEKTES